ncbi:MAG: heavy-metal-associated domain-containing protein [Ignavibacteria bacterium]|nr:heavy-metal-associated domain-containing protein [Ignavibacteria bacterium]
MENTGNISENLIAKKVSDTGSDTAEVFEFDIIGMDCTSCAKNIKTYLTKLKGISGVEINYAAESGEVIYDPELISRETIKKR